MRFETLGEDLRKEKGLTAIMRMKEVGSEMEIRDLKEDHAKVSLDLIIL